MNGFQLWLRQPSTITGLGILGGALAGALSNLVTGNTTIDTIAAVVVLVLTHLGIDDHSAVAQSAGALVRAAEAQAAQQPAAQQPAAPVATHSTSEGKV